MRPGRAAVLLVIAGLAIAVGRIEHDRVGGRPGRPGRSWSAGMAGRENAARDERIAALRELHKLVPSRGSAAEAPGGLSGAGLSADLRRLADLAGRKDEALATRFAALSVLEAEAFRTESPSAIASLARVLEDETDDPAVRCHVASVLAARASDPRCLRALRAAASSRSPELRQVVFNNLPYVRIDGAVLLDLVRQGMDDDSRAVRRAAVDVVGKLAAQVEPGGKTETQAAGLLGAILDGGELELRIQALRYLGSLDRGRSSEVRTRLDTALESAGLAARERMELASALLDATGDTARYLPVLVEGLRSESSPVWRVAASRLQRPGRGESGAQSDDETAATIAALEPLWKSESADVRSRAGVVLARLTRRPRAYLPSIGEGLTSHDRDTRVFAAGALRTLPASGWRRVVERRPRLAGPSSRTAAVLLIGLVAYVLWDMTRLSRRAARPTGRVAIRKPPRRIHLRPAGTSAWNDDAAVPQLLVALRTLGFEDVGPFEVAEIANARVWGLVRLEDGVHACIVEQAESGLQLSLSTDYEDGSGFVLTTVPAVERMEPPPWRRVVSVEAGRVIDVPSLYARHLRERPSGPVRRISAAAFAAHYARVHADGVDWRNLHGGMSAESIRALNRLRGLELSDQAIAVLRAQLQRRALEELDASLRERFLEHSGLPDADRTALSSRLVIVHDGLPLAEAGSARLAFAEHNRRVAETERYEKIGELVHPVAADVYLVPGGPAESKADERAS